MKLKLLFTVLCLIAGGLWTSQAQMQTKIGAALAYGTEIENIGLGATAEFHIAERISLSPNFIYYFPKEEGPIKVNWWEINADGHYYFLADDGIQVFGLAGVNYSQVKVKSDIDFGPFGGGDFEASDGRVGLNIGAGINFDLGSSLVPFAKLKYVIIDEGQAVIAAGVKFKI